MARLPRLSVPGELHLVVQRGHNRQAVFVDDEDRRQFMSALRDAAREHGLSIHAYSLLDTEVWLLGTPAQRDSLSKTMQGTGRRYVAGFNRRHGRSGTLWEGRFRATIVEASTHFLLASCLVDTKAVEAGLAGEATAWAWSSAAHHLGQRRDPVVQDHALYWALGNTPFDRELKYARALAEGGGSSTKELQRSALGGWAHGSPAFVARIAEESGRPAQPRPRGRPRTITSDPNKEGGGDLQRHK